MSNHQPNRHPSGSPIGGRFAEGSKAAPADGVQLEEERIELRPGGEYAFAGDGAVVEEYDVQRIDDTYATSALVPAGTAAELLGAEDVADEAYSQLMIGARWNAMTRFLESHFHGAMVSDRGDGDELVFDVGHDFEDPPTEQEVIDATWPMAAKIHNETDPGTFGVQHVGRSLREHLDQQAFCQSYPTKWGENEWLPRAPMPLEDALDEASNGVDNPVSDQAAQALAYHLASADGGPVYKQLVRDGFADRDKIAEEAARVDERSAEAAEALASWAHHQPTTSDLFSSAPRKTDAA